MKQYYHFIGIGGIGMAGLALMLLKKGYKVSGSDINTNSLIENLQQQGAEIHLTHSSKNIKQPDYIVFSSAINKNNPEYSTALEKNIPILHRSELLAQLMKEYETPITISGAHGKTSTSAMCADLLINANHNPSVILGGISPALESNVYFGTNKYLIAESDESDGSFLNYNPYYSILTNIDFEHINHYKNWDNILATYKQFIKKTHPNGTMIAFGDDEKLSGLFKYAPCEIISYGLSSNNTIQASNIKKSPFKISFTCTHNNKQLGDITLNSPGTHSILNALACISLGIKLQIPFDTIYTTLKNHKNVNRRFEIIGDIDDILIIDDYAHHPTEIYYTLNAAQQTKKSRLITVFQPHRYSRTKHLLTDFSKALKNTDELIITDIYGAHESTDNDLCSEDLVNKIKENSSTSVIYIKKENLTEYLRNFIKPKDLVLTLGAGDITLIGRKLAKILSCEKINK